MSQYGTCFEQGIIISKTAVLAKNADMSVQENLALVHLAGLPGVGGGWGEF